MNAINSFGRSRELIGVLAGTVSFATLPVLHAILTRPAWQFFVIIFLSSVAGFTVGAFSAQAGVEASVAVRRGVGAAAACAFVAASCFVFMTRSAVGELASLRGLLGGALSIIPSIFYGMLCAGVGALVLGRPAIDKRKLPPELLTLSGQWTLRVAVLMFAACAVASPFIPSSRPSPPPSLPPAPSPPAPTYSPPPFAYEMPGEMLRAPAPQWKQATQRVIGPVEGALAVLSNDGRWLAFVPQSSQLIRVLDLHTSSEKTPVLLSNPISRICFSPNADRLLAASATDATELKVIDLDSRRQMELPMPKKRAVPSGPFHWWQDKEVLFLEQPNGLSLLNLDTLEFDEASKVDLWKNATERERKRVTDELHGELAKTERWQWSIKPVVETAELPEVEGASSWPVNLSLCLAMGHPDHDWTQSFRNIGATPEDWFRASRDGSKVLRIRKGLLEVFYFELGAAPPMRWALAMPRLRESSLPLARVHEALDARQLRVLVYAPMHNPLNDRVVGPDRQRVKAVLSFDAWDENKALVHASQSFSDVAAGDIVADISRWDGTGMELLEKDTSHRWWIELLPAMEGKDNLASLPPSALAVPARKVTPAEQKVETTSVMADADRVEAFVRAHHQKAQRGDVRELVADYADKVDHFNNGVVDRAWILQDEMKYHAGHTVLIEEVIGGIRVDALPVKQGFTATYQLKTRTHENASGRFIEMSFNVEMTLVETTGHLEITRQRIEKKT